jgi:hypothetical protein
MRKFAELLKNLDGLKAKVKIQSKINKYCCVLSKKTKTEKVSLQFKKNSQNFHDQRLLHLVLDVQNPRVSGQNKCNQTNICFVLARGV